MVAPGASKVNTWRQEMTLLVVNDFVFVCSKLGFQTLYIICVPIYIYISSYYVLFFLTQLKTRATMAHILQENQPLWSQLSGGWTKPGHREAWRVEVWICSADWTSQSNVPMCDRITWLAREKCNVSPKIQGLNEGNPKTRSSGSNVPMQHLLCL